MRATAKCRSTTRFDRGFAVARTETTVAQFGRFIAATGYRTRADKRGVSLAYDAHSGNFAFRNNVDWRSDYAGDPAAPDLPVVHVSAGDAEAYAKWLSQQTGAHYRLPSESEFEYALRAGGEARYPWGDGPPGPTTANVTGGLDVSPQGRRWSNAFPGSPTAIGARPRSALPANAFGLHDMDGNVSEWVGDCWHDGYRRAPANGEAWLNPAAARGWCGRVVVERAGAMPRRVAHARAGGYLRMRTSGSGWCATSEDDGPGENVMRQDPFDGQAYGGQQPRRGFGISPRLLILLLFAGYAAYYWFSNRSTDPYTGETVTIDKNISPEDERRWGCRPTRKSCSRNSRSIRIRRSPGRCARSPSA